MTTAREYTSRLAGLLRCEHAAMTDFLVALADFDAKRLWVELGYRSLLAPAPASPAAVAFPLTTALASAAGSAPVTKRFDTVTCRRERSAVSGVDSSRLSWGAGRELASGSSTR